MRVCERRTKAKEGGAESNKGRDGGGEGKDLDTLPQSLFAQGQLGFCALQLRSRLYFLAAAWETREASLQVPLSCACACACVTVCV